MEWSTELTVTEAREEYIKAWFLCHVFAKEFGFSDSTDVIFNMSVGYSLDGIKSEKIDSYIEGMKNAESTEIWKSCRDYLANNIVSFDRFTKKDLDSISPAVSGGITLSTLHGCPREEIEKIAAYLMDEKGLHTYIKCNPTLLGYETARKLLDEMGYSYISFDDHHFNNDLKFNDAVDMLTRLQAKAKERKLDFGVKITNTFPVEIKRNELPGNEMYMSGRALFPLSINVAKKLAEAFCGKIHISYSGGADYFNLKDILETGIRPVTVATTILKPGGYERLTQLAELAENTMPNAPEQININALSALADSLPHRKRYRKEYRQTASRKHVLDKQSPASRSPLPLFDCSIAPCLDEGCPIRQNIPEYLSAVAEGDYAAAFKIIAKDNTAPSITGTICDHQCQRKCTRVDYEDPLQIRQAKLLAADSAQEAFTASLVARNLLTDKSVAVIGAGPAGIAAAVFLRRNGVPVTVYEKRDRPFGIVQFVIPAFRIPDKAINRDFQTAQKLGVKFLFNQPEQYSIADLQKKHNFTVIATGAWKDSALPFSDPVLPYPNYIDALRFLEDSKKTNCGLELGKKVAVIGGGDVAMDCARAAKRNKGVESVSIVYRRTREFMPSQYEEQDLALADGVEFKELLAPQTWAKGVLTCEVMRLGDEYESSGRRGIERTGEKEELRFDTVIGATGSVVDTEAFTRNGIALNEKGFPKINSNRESSAPGVYIAGDCKAGAATVVRAIMDGKVVAMDILRKLGLEADFSLWPATPAIVFPGSQTDFAALYSKKGVISEAQKDKSDGNRCLSCNILCEICADVCPNRANVAIELPASSALGRHQILHIDRMCNECGNCAVFCPHAGKPYKNKLTLFSSEEDFTESEPPGFVKTEAGTYKIRLEDKSVVNYHKGEKTIPDSWVSIIETIEAQYGYLVF